MIPSLIIFAIFDLSPTPGAVHGCEAWLRRMVPVPCVGEHPPPCEAAGPLVALPCEVAGNAALSVSGPRPGAVIAFCIYAETYGGRSGCAEPIVGVLL